MKVIGGRSQKQQPYQAARAPRALPRRRCCRDGSFDRRLFTIAAVAPGGEARRGGWSQDCRAPEAEDPSGTWLAVECLRKERRRWANAKRRTRCTARAIPKPTSAI